MTLICENKHCIYWKDYGCTEEKVIIEERGICSSCEEIYFQRLLDNDTMAYLRKESCVISDLRKSDLDAWYDKLVGNIKRIMDKQE